MYRTRTSYTLDLLDGYFLEKGDPQQLLREEVMLHIEDGE
jgi:hypothetical protein